MLKDEVLVGYVAKEVDRTEDTNSQPRKSHNTTLCLEVERVLKDCTQVHLPLHNDIFTWIQVKLLV